MVSKTGFGMQTRRNRQTDAQTMAWRNNTLTESQSHPNIISIVSIVLFLAAEFIFATRKVNILRTMQLI